uniref:ATP-dependent RNA helicase DBP3 n=1 Tax=Rhizophora mucronata TaxID=61149 RepID=A0A2P2K1B6_RHIMU
MVKGADAVARKKNKSRRKKLNNDKSNVSAHVASIIAAKKRRLSGKGRKCQGMCFSLPTPDDPFNDRHGKKDEKGGGAKKIASPQMDKKCLVKRKTAALRKETLGENNGNDEKAMRLRYQLKSSSIVNNSLAIKSCIDEGNMKIQPNGKGSGHDHQAVVSEITDCPSKFLVLCLNAIEQTLCHEGTYNSDDGKPLFVDPWGVEFLKCYSAGGDILETSGSSCSINQISWMVSIAADTIARKEKNGLSFASPFLLFLVSSQEKAAEVRLMCKPLKALGIHTVSLHPGASLDHQIRGLKGCEPEFLVSTPERLLELVSMKAIDITGVSFLVVDGLESFYKDGRLDAVKSIRQSISGNLLTVIFNNFFSNICTGPLQDIIFGPIHRLSLNPSIPSQSACIIQNVCVCSNGEERHTKVCPFQCQIPGFLIFACDLSFMIVLIWKFAAKFSHNVLPLMC